MPGMKKFETAEYLELGKKGIVPRNQTKPPLCPYTCLRVSDKIQLNSSRGRIFVEQQRLAKMGYLALSAIFYISGAAYIILPEVPPPTLCTIGGIVLIAYGIIKIIGYFSKDLYCLAFQYDLACGLFLIVLGIITLARNQQIIPHLSISLGALILLDSLLTVQMSKDARQFGLETWYVLLTAAVIAGVFGGLVIIHPFHTPFGQHIIAGCALLAQGAKSHCVVHLTVKTIEEPPVVPEGESKL